MTLTTATTPVPRSSHQAECQPNGLALINHGQWNKRMQEKIQVMFDGWQTVMVYLFATFSGALGGVAVAANKHVQAKSLKTFSALSLSMLGIFSGMLVASYLLAGYPVFGLVEIHSFHEIIFWALVSGFGGAILIGGMNLSAGVLAVIIMKRFGLPVELVLPDKDKR